MTEDLDHNIAVLGAKILLFFFNTKFFCHQFMLFYNMTAFVEGILVNKINVLTCILSQSYPQNIISHKTFDRDCIILGTHMKNVCGIR